MNKLFQSILLFAGACASLCSCSNGQYSASPSSNANSSINPLQPLTSSQFTWGGTAPMSADINGTHWLADYATYGKDSLFANEVVGYKSADGTILAFYLSDSWANNLYNTGYQQYKRYGVYIDHSDSSTLSPFLDKTSAAAKAHNYYSYIGNSGEVNMIRNDSAYFEGKFYFQGVNAAGQIINVMNGYFKVPTQ